MNKPLEHIGFVRCIITSSGGNSQLSMIDKTETLRVIIDSINKIIDIINDKKDAK